MDTSRIAEKARYLKLSAFTLSEGMRTGAFRSCFRGSGMEFDGVREYEPGDDIRSIDWNVTARTGNPFIKLYREERELTVFLVVDDSLSMITGTAGVSRKETALEACALLAFASEYNASPFGSVVFDGAVGRVFKPRTGRDHVLSLLSDLEQRKRIEKGSVLSAAISGASRVLRARALVVIVSDFRSAGYEKSLGILSRRHDVLAIRITSPSDSILPNTGYLSFRDPESGHQEEYPTGSPAFRSYWEREAQESITRWEYRCLRLGAFPLIMTTEDDPGAVLTQFFSGRRRSASRNTTFLGDGV
ncbi:MAG TPA: DUF58 domain-containing protein [Treponema sp.]|nr:DUF58 domain-containing protein [Treponema sp.]